MAGDRRPAEPLECRQAAERALEQDHPAGGPLRGIAWALLAVAGEVASIRREMAKRR